MTAVRHVVIRDATAADEPSLARLWNPWSARVALGRVATRELIYLVAEVEGEVAGQLCIDTRAMPGTGYVYAISVLEGQRSRGIGRRLLAAAGERAQAHGWTALTLKVEHTNDRARALYERSGYRVIGDGFDEWDERTATGEFVRHVRVATWLMRRELRP